MLRCGNTPTWLTTQLIGVVTMTKRGCSVKTPTTKEEVVKTRQYTVGYAPNRGKSNPSPQLIISGKWLNAIGFTVGNHFTLTRQAEQLIIQLAEG
ncbi:TPA: SymE family type I addiction module toxin [Providencia stuartii]|uniref:SymE family type I addiction module toxin n=2 Tax=Morganellaceae TaxID=1903414 RepID=UPI0004F81185|nr:toxin SymE, type I toxin-antitoxin system family protein [Providencia stuartii]